MKTNIEPHLSIFMLFMIPLVGFTQSKISVKRLEGNPMITPQMFDNEDGVNINGPSLIKVPDWVEGALGKYYLYFAHHMGKYIRMAHADDLNGPWTIYRPGVLNNDQTVFGNGPDQELDLIGIKTIWVAHIASPDVIIDNQNKTIKMYFHGLGPKIEQCHCTSIATSKNGLIFSTIEDSQVIEESYLREFQYNGYYYTIGRLGKLFRSKNGINQFEQGHNPFDSIIESAPLRHPAVLLDGHKLLVFYSRMGDTPERIVLSEIALNDDWTKWKASPPVTIISPELDYEGVDLELKKSDVGSAKGELRELRDPYIYKEGNRLYLLYSIKGESGIAIVELIIK